MSCNLGAMESYVEQRHAELLRQVQHDQLVRQARGPDRPVRLRLAELLYALADRVSGEACEPCEAGQIVLAS